METAASYARARSLQQSLAAIVVTAFTQWQCYFILVGWNSGGFVPLQKIDCAENNKGNSPSLYCNMYIYSVLCVHSCAVVKKWLP